MNLGLSSATKSTFSTRIQRLLSCHYICYFHYYMYPMPIKVLVIGRWFISFTRLGHTWYWSVMPLDATCEDIEVTSRSSRCLYITERWRICSRSTCGLLYPGLNIDPERGTGGLAAAGDHEDQGSSRGAMASSIPTLAGRTPARRRPPLLHLLPHRPWAAAWGWSFHWFYTLMALMQSWLSTS